MLNTQEPLTDQHTQKYPDQDGSGEARLGTTKR